MRLRIDWRALRRVLEPNWSALRYGVAGLAAGFVAGGLYVNSHVRPYDVVSKGLPFPVVPDAVASIPVKPQPEPLPSIVEKPLLTRSISPRHACISRCLLVEESLIQAMDRPGPEGGIDATYVRGLRLSDPSAGAGGMAKPEGWVD